MKLSISQKSVWQPCCSLTPMGAQAQKSKQKKQVTDVPAIASADSAKIAIDSMLTAQDSSKLASLNQQQSPTQKRNWAACDQIPSAHVVSAGITWCRTDIQSQILETAFHLWRFRRLYIRHHLEQPDVSRLFASLHGYYGR